MTKKRRKKSRKARANQATRTASAKRKQSKGTTKGRKPKSTLRGKVTETAQSLKNRIDSSDIYHVTIREMDGGVKQISGDIDTLIKSARKDKTPFGKSIAKVLRQIKEELPKDSHDPK